MKLVFATANPGKLREAAEILGPGFTLLSSAQAGVTEDIPETGETLRENSLQKARCLRERTGLDCFADDTGLEVDLLDGAPGVHTARYGGPGRDFQANMDRLLSELEPLQGPRTARFRTVVALLLGKEEYLFEGVMEGEIALHKAGLGGFGYDPVFIPSFLPVREAGHGTETALVPNTLRLTAAEISEDAKNLISHRGRALRAMASFLHSIRRI